MNVPKEDQHWRRFGMELREKLLVRDASSGGTLFKINGQCHISQYLQVSERAMDQFYALLAKATDMEQTYVMGYRIASFLTIALPQHPDYPTNIGCSRMREIRQQLERLRHCLEELAMMIDESQLDKFFSEDFDPVIHKRRILNTLTRFTTFYKNLDSVQIAPKCNVGNVSHRYQSILFIT